MSGQSTDDRASNVPKEVQDIIRESGNSFHAKVARWLVNDGWQIRVSPYYMDQSQNKAREIDLIAEKSFEIREPMFGRSVLGDVVVRLFVECKFLPKTSFSMFWFTPKDKKAATDMICAQGGGFRRDNAHTPQHHYLAQSPRVAKVFASTGKGEQDPFYKALNQVLSAQTSMQHQSPISVEDSRSLHTLNFPVVVCNSFESLYETDFYGAPDPRPIAEGFQLEVQYAYTARNGNQRDDYFLIDVVAFDQLPELSKALEQDAELAIYMLQPD